MKGHILIVPATVLATATAVAIVLRRPAIGRRHSIPALSRTRVRSILVMPRSPGATRCPKRRNRPRKKLARR